MFPPVASPVPRPACTTNAPPATSVPRPLSPFNVAATGLALVSALPKTTLLFLRRIVLSLVIVAPPAIASPAFAVTARSVLTVKLVALNVAPLTGQLPSRLVIPVDPKLTVSPALIPNVSGV